MTPMKSKAELQARVLWVDSRLICELLKGPLLMECEYIRTFIGTIVKSGFRCPESNITHMVPF